jgi:peroxiredoxin Q/BCP
MLNPGDRLPLFSLVNQHGVRRTPADYAGRWLILYVYPKDDTPGCTIQGRSFTATRSRFERAEATVVGISADDETSHRQFCNKHGLQIELLADPEAQLLTSLGVGQKEWQGALFWNRTTFVIDPTGIVRKVYEKVDPNGHEELLLKELESLGAGSSA